MVAARYLIAMAAIVAMPLATHADVVNGSYVGSAKTTVKYLDPNTLAVVSTESYARKTKINIAPPKISGGGAETNPFSFGIAPFPRDEPLVAGALFAASARLIEVDGRDVLLQYWNAQNTTTGFTASLVNNHASEGLAKDRIMAFLGGADGKLKPFLMHDANVGAGLQCKMTGTATDRKLVIDVGGYAFVPNKAIIQFNTRINGRRP
jgi:hypothetical protein